VTRTDPEAGEGRNYKARITIYISTGVGKTFMPDIVGLSREDAEKAFKYICTGWDYHDACEHFGLDADAIAILDKILEEAEM
jgi:hypothetical protein